MGAQVLIPLKSGLSYYLPERKLAARSGGLNPFEIRAELLPMKSQTSLVLLCLNPFEIRAELLHNKNVDILAVEVS